MKTYSIHLNGEQLRVIIIALEAYTRLCLAQFDYAIEKSTIKIPIEKLPGLKDRCNELKTFLTGIMNNASYGIGSKEYTEPARIAHDIHEVLRNYRAWDECPEGGIGVDFYTPLKIGQEPLITIERTDSCVTDDGWSRKKPDTEGKYLIKKPRAKSPPNEVKIKKGIVINRNVRIPLSEILDNEYLWKKIA